MNIHYKKLGSGDLDQLKALLKIYADVFNLDEFIMPDSSYLNQLLDSGNILFYVAIYEQHIVGGLTAHILPSTYNPSSEAYIYDLAVYGQYQRSGIGRQLINSLNRYCKSVGIKEVFVQADSEDQHAIEFYRSTGGKPEQVVHFTYDLSH
ncbi:MAG: GNAT family N-acetyltransferase [Paludibacter sp.]|nr:GNAT family N-acetyltransferase [Paludibacter sp.]